MKPHKSLLLKSVYSFITLIFLFTLSPPVIGTDDDSHKKQKMQRSISFRPIESLNLPNRLQNPLKAAGINYVGILFTLTEKEFLRIPRFGPKSYAEVKAVLNQLQSTENCFSAWK